MADIETLETLAQHLDFEFDSSTCSVSNQDRDFFAMSDPVVMSEVNDIRYVEFMKEPYRKPPYNFHPVDGIVDKNVSDRLDYGNWVDEDLDSKPQPDDARDKTLHGLLNERDGHIALYTPFRTLKSFYRFQTINGAGGVNKMNTILGRLPGVDIPTFVPGDDDQGSSTAGEITEAIADMKMVVPGVNDFYMAQHDLGGPSGFHGPSWPHTHPAAYQQLSRAAQGVIEKHGSRIHIPDEEAGRPPAVATISRTLDNLMNRLEPTITSLTVMETRVRDGRYDETDNVTIASGILRQAFKTARYRQHQTAHNFLVLGNSESEPESYRMGYWIGMQLVAGVVETRAALHEAQPHVESTDDQVQRTLEILNILKKEVDRRLEENKEYLL